MSREHEEPSIVPVTNRVSGIEQAHAGNTSTGGVRTIESMGLVDLVSEPKTPLGDRVSENKIDSHCSIKTQSPMLSSDLHTSCPHELEQTCIRILC